MCYARVNSITCVLGDSQIVSSSLLLLFFVCRFFRSTGRLSVDRVFLFAKRYLFVCNWLLSTRLFLWRMKDGRVAKCFRVSFQISMRCYFVSRRIFPTLSLLISEMMNEKHINYLPEWYHKQFPSIYHSNLSAIDSMVSTVLGSLWNETSQRYATVRQTSKNSKSLIIFIIHIGSVVNDASAYI